MKRILLLVITLAMTYWPAPAVQGMLIDMGDGTIYDSDTRLSWLRDVGMGGLRTWLDAGNWAENLVFAGFDNWRLPNAVPNPEGPHIITYNMTGSEMGHLYYKELNNLPALGGEAPPLNSGLFIDLKQYAYWASGDGAPGQMAWAFNFSGGGQNAGPIDSALGAWAVREGERPAPVPVPSSLLLLGSGLVFVFWKKIRRRNHNQG